MSYISYQALNKSTIVLLDKGIKTFIIYKNIYRDMITINVLYPIFELIVFIKIPLFNISFSF